MKLSWRHRSDDKRGFSKGLLLERFESRPASLQRPIDHDGRRRDLDDRRAGKDSGAVELALAVAVGDEDVGLAGEPRRHDGRHRVAVNLGRDADDCEAGDEGYEDAGRHAGFGGEGDGRPGGGSRGEG